MIQWNCTTPAGMPKKHILNWISLQYVIALCDLLFRIVICVFFVHCVALHSPQSDVVASCQCVICSCIVSMRAINPTSLTLLYVAELAIKPNICPKVGRSRDCPLTEARTSEHNSDESSAQPGYYHHQRGVLCCKVRERNLTCRMFPESHEILSWVFPHWSAISWSKAHNT